MGEMSCALRRSEEEQKEREAPFVPFRRTVPGPVLAPARRGSSVSTPVPVVEVPTEMPVREPIVEPASSTATPPPTDAVATEVSKDPERLSTRRTGFANPAAKIEMPRAKKGDWRPRSVALDRPNRAVERFRQLGVRVSQLLDEREENTLVVTSPGVGEGKTTTAFNLALAMASLGSGERVALVDLNLRRPAITYTLGVKAQAGVESAIQGFATAESRCARTDFTGLDVFPVGSMPQAPHELFVSKSFAEFVDNLGCHYRSVVFDAPPVLAFPDVELMLQKIQSCLLVTRSRRTRTKNLDRALKQIRSDQMLGVFLNEDPWSLDSNYGGGN
ncbi:MAG: CpsD/CapB family tyrosine-protein kinase [Myxococcales bacterium]|nr:CpsD/CapB family tyrosine-protein kinase [Myxococcales bacterium]